MGAFQTTISMRSKQRFKGRFRPDRYDQSGRRANGGGYFERPLSNKVFDEEATQAERDRVAAMVTPLNIKRAEHRR